MFTIQSILDLDLYKLTVQQIVFHRFSNISVSYEFKCRNIKMPDGSKVSSDMLFKYVSLDMVEEEIEKLNKLTLTNDEYDYLESLDYFESTYLSFLKNFRFDTKKDLEIYPVNKDQWAIKATGPWVQVILYETMILSIVNNLFVREWIEAHQLNCDEVESVGKNKLKRKIKQLKLYHESNKKKNKNNQFNLIEFGTRRRASFDWQDYVVKTLLGQIPNNLIGTSNICLAYKYGIKPTGTFPHELPMVMQSQVPVHKSAKYTYQLWINEYEGKLATCLADTLGHDKFWKDFSFDLAKAYDGVRHDSGCPYEFAQNVIEMYKHYGLNPLTKHIVFSDGLDIPKAINIHEKFCNQILCLFGIGTNLTNDIDLPVPQIVVKAIKADEQPVAKLSADIGKISCEDVEYIRYLQHSLTYK